MTCRCGARAGYRLWRKHSGGNTAFYLCPACATHFDNETYEHESLPHVREAGEELVYCSYRQQRTEFPHIAPERWAKAFRETFGPRIEQLEARYQAESQRRTA